MRLDDPRRHASTRQEPLGLALAGSSVFARDRRAPWQAAHCARRAALRRAVADVHAVGNSRRRREDVEAAQMKIVQTARKMIDEGKIVFLGADTV